MVIFKWIKGVLTHPIRIIKGHWYNYKDKNNKLYKIRYKHCNYCKEKEDSRIGELCGLCGCPLKSKLRIREEKCELNRWN